MWVCGVEWNSQTETKIFDEWEKFDLSLIISIGYRFRDLTFDFVIDKGFFIPMEEKMPWLTTATHLQAHNKLLCLCWDTTSH